MPKRLSAFEKEKIALALGVLYFDEYKIHELNENRTAQSSRIRKEAWQKVQQNLTQWFSNLNLPADIAQWYTRYISEAKKKFQRSGAGQVGINFTEAEKLILDRIGYFPRIETPMERFRRFGGEWDSDSSSESIKERMYDKMLEMFRDVEAYLNRVADFLIQNMAGRNVGIELQLEVQQAKLASAEANTEAEKAKLRVEEARLESSRIQLEIKKAELKLLQRQLGEES